MGIGRASVYRALGRFYSTPFVFITGALWDKFIVLEILNSKNQDSKNLVD
jgi:hypothetical protein